MGSQLPALLTSESLFRIALILIIALVLRISLALFLNGFLHRVAANASRTRITTLSSVVSAVVSTVLYLVTFIIILRELGFDVTPLLASAGVVGIALAFGAQTLVKDLLSGFFLLIEDQIREGETIKVVDKKGVVEKATLRTVTIREKEGEVTIIPYSSITVVTNFSRKKEG